MIVARSYFDAIENHPDDGLLCEDVSLAVQSSKDECDINVIVKRYLKTGILPEVNRGVYADISAITDLADCMHQAQEAEEAFMLLPAEIRREFDNDPRKLVAFAADDRNYDRAVELGLVEPKRSTQPPAADPAAVSPPTK